MKFGAGILADLRARAPWYVSDWKEGFGSGYRYESFIRLAFPSVEVYSVPPSIESSRSRIEIDRHNAVERTFRSQD